MKNKTKSVTHSIVASRAVAGGWIAYLIVWCAGIAMFLTIVIIFFSPADREAL
jgi:hypothetical protein